MIQPPSIRYAGFLTAAEGIAALIMAVVLLVRAVGGADQHIASTGPPPNLQRQQAKHQ